MAADGHSPFGGPLFFPDSFYLVSDSVLQPDRSSPVENHIAPSNPTTSVLKDDSAGVMSHSGKSAPSTGPSPDGFSPVGAAQADSLDGNPSLHGEAANPNTAMVPFVPPREEPSNDSAESRPPKTYATASAPKQVRPPPRFVTNLTTFNPVKRGNSTFLKMPEDLYQKRLAAFAFALIGRIFLPKQAKQRPLPDLKSELQSLFKIEQDWSLNTLGKGFFSLKFSSQADQNRAARFFSWRLKEGSFSIREWKPNFDPYKENTSATQIWVRLFHLPEEYWDPDFLVGIFRAVGNVVKLDGSTAYGMVGHFARALVEVDLNFPLAETVTIEGLNTSFEVEFGFENLPLFCTYCKYIGHDVNDCRNRKKADAEHSHEEAPQGDNLKHGNRPRRRNRNRNRGKWVEVDNSANENTVATRNPFDALANDEENNDQHGSTSSRQLVPLSPEVAAAVEKLKTQDFSSEPHYEEDSESGEDVENVQPSTQETSPPQGAANQEAAPSQDAAGPTNADPSNSGLHFTEQGLKDLAKRIATLSGKPSTPPSGAAKVERKLKTLYDTGTKSTAYAIEPGEVEAVRSMHNVATLQWTQQIDDATEAGKPLESSRSPS